VRITGQFDRRDERTRMLGANFDGGLEDVFELQDRMTARYRAFEPRFAAGPNSSAGTANRPRLPGTIWPGLASQRRFTREANAESVQLFREAIKLDRNLASAYALASNCYTWAKAFGWLTNPAVEIAEGEQWARRALDLGREDGPAPGPPPALPSLISSETSRSAMRALDRALVLHPGAATLGVGGWIKVLHG